jgi:transketolase
MKKPKNALVAVKPKNQDLMLNSWVEEISGYVSEETHKLIKNVGEVKKAEERIATKFVKFYVSEAVLNALKASQGTDMDNEEAYEFTKEKFKDIKEELQSEISQGFELAFKLFSGKSPEYYCQIRMVPEPPSQTVN